MSAFPSSGGLTPDQIQALNQAPVTPNAGAAPIQQSTPLTPAQVAIQTAGVGPGLQQPSLWDNLMKVAGNLGSQSQPKMPGTTVGAPAGASGAMAPPAPPMPQQGQMQTPPGMGAYFRALQQPAAGGAGNPGLMAQYMALQQLMRGA